MTDSNLPTGSVPENADRETVAIIAALLQQDGHRARTKWLRRNRDRLTQKVAAELCRRAHAIQRTRPHDAGRLAQAGYLVARAIRCKASELLALNERAMASIVNGKGCLALESAERADRLAQHVGTPNDRAEAALLRLHALTLLERYPEARRSGERALSEHEAEGNVRGTILAHLALADIAFREDRHRDALRHYTSVERALPEQSAPRIRAILAMNRANSLEARNRYNAASRQFGIARELFMEAGADHSVAQVEYNHAYADMLRGRYADALRRYAEVETRFTDLEDVRHLAHVNLDRAELHLLLNMPDDAARYAEAAEKTFDTICRTKELAQAAQYLGESELLRRRDAEADAALARAARSFAGLKLPGRRITCVVGRARVALRSGDAALAHRMLDEASGLLDRTTPTLTRAAVVLTRAAADFLDGRTELAREAAGQVLEDLRRVQAPALQVDALRIVGRAHVAAGATELALDAYRQAVDVLESSRDGVPADAYMAAFLAGRSELFEEIVTLLVDSGETDEAFRYTERAKARALADLLAASGRTDGETIAGAAAARLEHLRESLHAVYGRLTRRDTDADQRGQRFVVEAREQAVALEGEIERLLRDARGSRSAVSSDAVDVDAVRRALGPDAALVEYFICGSTLFVFVVTQTETHVVRVHGVDTVQARLDRFHYHLARAARAEGQVDTRLLDATRANLGRLADLLFEPVRERLDVRRLVVVPHGMLHHVPFHALPLGEGWVADRYEVVYAPSAAVFAMCARRKARATGPAAVFALPDEQAPRIAEESAAVSRALGDARVHLAEEATFDRLREEASRARTLHVATHGMFRRAHPMLSSIRLADRWVNLYDLYDLDVRSELVVLATCESGTASVTDGDEILGLARGFLRAGAPALLTSQWAVDDGSTATFMRVFYESLADAPDAAAAYSEALSQVRALHPHPYHWAPFFLAGHPVRRTAPPESARAQSYPEPAAVAQLACASNAL